jgi:hypothetical protein
VKVFDNFEIAIQLLYIYSVHKESFLDRLQFLQHEHLSIRALKHLPKKLPSSVHQTHLLGRLRQVEVAESLLEAISQAETDILEDCLHCVLLGEGVLSYLVG